MPENPSVIELRPAPTRRVFDMSVLGGLGLLLACLCVSDVETAGRSSAFWRGVWVALALACFVLAIVLYQATAQTLALTHQDLREGRGRVLARIDQIAYLERRRFALKPSNGFTLVLHKAAPFGWAPGVWWRLGTRLGVGGVISAAQAKALADTIDMLLREPKGQNLPT